MRKRKRGASVLVCGFSGWGSQAEARSRREREGRRPRCPNRECRAPSRPHQSPSTIAVRSVSILSPWRSIRMGIAWEGGRPRPPKTRRVKTRALPFDHDRLRSPRTRNSQHDSCPPSSKKPAVKNADAPCGGRWRGIVLRGRGECGIMDGEFGFMGIKEE